MSDLSLGGIFHTMHEIVLTIANQLAELERLEDEVERFATENQAPDQLLSMVRLVLEEVISNIIRYGYDDNQRHDIVVHVVVAARELLIEVSDDGKPFDLTLQPEPDLSLPVEQRPVGGLGIHLVRQCMDRIEYERRDGRNWVRLIRRLVV